MLGGIYENKGKQGTGWVMRFKSITRRSNDKDYLERLLTGLRYELDKGTFDPRDYRKEEPLGFENLSNAYLEKRRDARSFNKMKNHIGYAQNYFHNKNIKAIRYGELEDFFNWLPDHLSGKTRHNIKTTLHAFWRWLCKRDRNIEMPDFPEIRFELGWRNTIDKQTQFKILDEIRRISWDINPKIYIGILFLSTYPNVRPIELLNVKEGDIDLINGIITVKYNKVPGRYTKIYLIEDDVRLLKQFPRGLPGLYFFRHDRIRKGVHEGNKGQFGGKYFYKWWIEACENLKIKDIDLYGGTRHSTVIELGKDFTPEQIMSDGTGHTTNKAFSRYFQLTADKKREIYRIARGKVSDTKLIRLSDVKEASK